ncbi:hypothetical protein DY245_09345 [Streptomyces inhibens]|uniref:Uncharacterized protein n=1 Tax=Streptomyces inhibens TaxID=2293571 RepID=A0A371Q7F2_STRIH|nr:hypothetical protein DY245_09345 [Streptomyces inhibens]
MKQRAPSSSQPRSTCSDTGWPQRARRCCSSASTYTSCYRCRLNRQPSAARQRAPQSPSATVQCSACGAVRCGA